MSPAAEGNGDRHEGDAPGSSRYRRILLGLFCAGIATFGQLYAYQAILPEVSADLGSDAASTALTVSAVTLGIALSVIPWSAVADRAGRVPAMAASVGLASVFALAGIAADELAPIVVLRLLEGLALGGVPAIAIAYLNEEVDRRYAARASAIYVAGTSIGGLSGRIISGPVTELTGSWRMGVLGVILVCVAAAIVFLAVVPRARGFVPLRRRTVRPEVGTLGLVRRHLREPRTLVLFVAAFLLMGSLVAIYNYLGFRLTQPPYELPQTVISVLFLAYLLGTVSSSLAGRVAERAGRLATLLGSTAVMLLGAVITLAAPLWAILTGLLLVTAGFFAAHAIAAGWIGAIAVDGRAQAGSLYNLFYYAGSSALGWLGGIALQRGGWPGVVTMVSAALLACLTATALVHGRSLR